MVCDRCIFVVSQILDELRLEPVSIALGEVDFGDIKLEQSHINLIAEKFNPLGFELIDNKKSRLIEAIKRLIIELVHNPQGLDKIKLSDYLSERLHHDYTHLSQLFSSVESITIEHFFIRQKVERVKEFIVYDELNLTQIAGLLGYSSSAHLSSQFKKITGMPPSRFKRLNEANQRRSLDKV